MPPSWVLQRRTPPWPSGPMAAKDDGADGPHATRGTGVSSRDIMVLCPKPHRPSSPTAGNVPDGECMSILVRVSNFSSLFSSSSVAQVTRFEVGMHKAVNMTATRDFFLKSFSWLLLIDCLTENSRGTEGRTEILSE